jgi:hypothetical protein
MRRFGSAALLLALASQAGAQQPPERASELAPPVKLEAGGKPIDVTVGHAAPFVHDMDGDGAPDLLVGQFGEGKLHLFRNEGTAAAPKLAASRWVEADGAPMKTEAG